MEARQDTQGRLKWGWVLWMSGLRPRHTALLGLMLVFYFALETEAALCALPYVCPNLLWWAQHPQVVHREPKASFYMGV